MGKGAASPQFAGDDGHRSEESDASPSRIRHSLRTPLNQIIGYSEMLQEEAADLGISHRLRDLQKLSAAGTQLLTLINDFTSPARVKTGKIDLDSLQRGSLALLGLILTYSEVCQRDAELLGEQIFVADLKNVHSAATRLSALLTDTNFLRPLADCTEPAVPTPPREVANALVTSFHPVDHSDAPASSPLIGTVLVVDDNEANRDMLCRRLRRQGHTVLQSCNGHMALELLDKARVDLILLDILMPELDGLQTLGLLKANPAHRHVPVIMLSALDELDSVVRCIEIGAEDYLPKPFNPVILNARIGACLEKKRLRDQEHAYIEQLHAEQEKSERLLLNILPKSIADRLRQGESTIADSFLEATVLFADLGGFTRLSSEVQAPDLVRLLNEIFSKFDWLAEIHQLEKIKTIGDAYMVVGGVPAPRKDHAEAVAEMALDMQKVVGCIEGGSGRAFKVRIGISSGPVVAGIIGSKKFIYDLWGDTVNIASRMESLCPLGSIQVTEATYRLLHKEFAFNHRGRIQVKGKGKMKTYFLVGRKSALPSS